MTRSLRRIVTLTGALCALSVLTACEPAVGTPEWCEMMKEKGAENITAKEAAEFTKSCLL